VISYYERCEWAIAGGKKSEFMGLSWYQDKKKGCRIIPAAFLIPCNWFL